uniref:Uncharacterized protein n=1 Tax=Triticum urartu TaxID=4572 RepID=A0A8R7QAK2_TRIUA
MFVAVVVFSVPSPFRSSCRVLLLQETASFMLLASKLVKYLTSAGSLQGHAESLSDASVRYFSSASSSQTNSTDENGFKGHGMLAPFTAGWQSNDVHLLVIGRSEGSYVYDINIISI